MQETVMHQTAFQETVVRQEPESKLSTPVTHRTPSVREVIEERKSVSKSLERKPQVESEFDQFIKEQKLFCQQKLEQIATQKPVTIYKEPAPKKPKSPSVDTSKIEKSVIDQIPL